MMMNRLEPAAVWHAFEEISRIPRGDGNIERIADYIYNEALSHGMSCIKDEKHNVVVWIPPTMGRENDQPITIQAHLYMLGIKADESEHEFEEDGIELMVEGDRLWANGTTLGADNDIGIAMMMALFRDKRLNHPELELIFSAVEASGQKTDFDFKNKEIKGRRLINLDYDKDSIFISGTSGVMVSQLLVPVIKESDMQGEALYINLNGLKGGHSILEIDKERGNAIQMLGRLLTEVKDECKLVDLYADHHFNAIPNAASAVIMCEMPMVTEQRLNELFDEMKEEQEALSEATLSIEYHMLEEGCYSDESFDKILSLIALTPNGMLSRDLSNGLPMYTNNMYSIYIDNGMLMVGNMTRYSKQTLGKDFSDRMCYLAGMLKGDVKIINNMPVWEPDDDQMLMDVSTHAYDMHAAMYLQVRFSHEATETAVLGDAASNMEIITLSPAIQSAHTVNESISISSVQRTYVLLRSILASDE